MKVSVALPCYNMRAFVGEAVESVLAQTHQDWELLVVDDGSTDGSSDVVSKYNDPRVRLIRQDNQGLSAARNTALGAASGEYVCFLDADDRYAPAFIETCLALLAPEPDAIAALTAARFFDHATGETLQIQQPKPDDALRRLLEFRGPVVCSPGAILLRRETADETGIFDTAYRHSEDWDYWTRLAARGRFIATDKIGVEVRAHAGQMSRNIDAFAKYMRLGFAKAKARGYFDSPRHYRYCAARLELIIAASYFRHNGDWRRAAAGAFKSLELHPAAIAERLTGRFQ